MPRTIAHIPARPGTDTDATEVPVYLSLSDMVQGRAMSDDAPDMNASDYDASVAIALD